jgi:exosome complex RNA-binding protein Rrp42 (RNase PH superfamily)
VHVTASAAHACVQEALQAEVRADGRGRFDGRRVTLDVAPGDGTATAAFGGTRALATLRAELAEVRGASKEGRLVTDVKFSPMASTAFDSVRAVTRAGASWVPHSTSAHRTMCRSSNLD